MRTLANYGYTQTCWKIFVDMPVHRETSCHKHCSKEKPQLFSAYDMDGTEVEVLDFLYAFVRMTKPMHVLETGTWKAYGTIALACALKDNGFGKLVSIEYDKLLAGSASRLVAKCGLSDSVTVVHSASLPHIEKMSKVKNIKFDFAFFDSTRQDRPKEFELLMKNKMLSGIACFHDTSRLRQENHKGKDGVQDKYVKELDRLEKKYAKGALEFALSRGLRIFSV